jgi:hypothetical protein
MTLNNVSSKWIVLVIIAIILGLNARFAQENILYRARLSLLFRGYIDVLLKDPDVYNEAVAPNTFVLKLVYSRGQYVGYINPYGHFLGRSQQGDGLQREGRITFFLFALQIGSGVICLAGLVAMFLRVMPFQMFRTRLRAQSK